MLRLLYFQGWKNVEVQISLCLGIPSFVAATLVLFSTTTGFLDMDLQAGFDDANQRTAVLFDKLQMAPSVFSSEDFFRVALAFISTVIAIIFFLPTLRYSRCYNDMLSIHQDEMNISSFDKLLLHMNFVMPFLVAISFVRPMTMDLVLPALVKCNATNKDCHSDPVVEEVFFYFRVQLEKSTVSTSCCNGDSSNDFDQETFAVFPSFCKERDHGKFSEVGCC